MKNQPAGSQPLSWTVPLPVSVCGIDRFYYAPILFDLALFLIGIVLLQFNEVRWTCAVKECVRHEAQFLSAAGRMAVVGAFGGAIIYIFGFFARPCIFGLEYGGGGIRDVMRGYERRRYFFLPPKMVGYVESFLYPTSLLLGVPAFVLAWLGLNVAGNWDAWRQQYPGRSRFQLFLVNSALSIAFGFIAYLVILHFGDFPPECTALFYAGNY